MEPECFGHHNGFVHLDVDLGGLEKDFDLGVKFETRESADSTISPQTGIQTWSEPLLALYVSFDSLAPGPRRHGTLRYALGRSRWSDQTTLNRPGFPGDPII